jgi:hypothetical protein
MKEVSGMARFIEIDGRTYDLSHLDRFSFDFVVPAKDGRPAQVYSIEVLLSWHCFTRGIAEGETFAPGLACNQGREMRLFDERRYRLSTQLPSIIREIGSRKCFHTGKGNFFIVELVEDDKPRVEYTVFFKMTRRGKRGALTLSVESAYPRDRAAPLGRARPPRPIRFSVIAYNTAQGKPIKQPK